MPSNTHFVQECPTCGRSLRIRVEYHDRRVTCQHCGGIFRALDESALDHPAVDTESALYRADQLLQMMEREALSGVRPAEPV